MTFRRVVDLLFFGYFAFQVPSTMFFDTQSTFPSWIYPKWLQNVYQSYLTTSRDPFMADPMSFPWFVSIITVEFPLEIPFYPVAAYAYYKGAAKCPWIRIPALVYSVHTATSVLGLLYTVCLSDFSNCTVPAPRNYHERAKIVGLYFPFLFFCVLIMLDTCFSSVYTKKREKME